MRRLLPPGRRSQGVAGRSAAVATLQALINATCLAAPAENKVAGLALTKFTGVGVAAPFAAFLMDSDWQLLAGVFPQYWVGRVLVPTQTGWELVGVAAAGLAVHGVYLVFFLRKFRGRVG